jgi:hypothetical protein
LGEDSVERRLGALELVVYVVERRGHGVCDGGRASRKVGPFEEGRWLGAFERARNPRGYRLGMRSRTHATVPASSDDARYHKRKAETHVSRDSARAQEFPPLVHPAYAVT